MFELFWKRYPRRVAKKAAQKAYEKAAKQYGHEAIMASLEVMLVGEWRGREPQYIPHAASYLNREIFEETRGEMLEDEQPVKGQHCCRICRPPHYWTHECDTWCWNDREKVCPEERIAMREAIQSGLDAKFGAAVKR